MTFALDHELDPPLVVLPILVGGWDPDPREGPEDRRPGGGQTGRVGAPERRIRRQPEQNRDVDPHPVGDVDRLIGVVDTDVYVHPEDQLLARDEAQRRDQVAVARAGDDPLVLPHREWMRPGGPDREPLRGCRLIDLPAQRAQLLAGLDRARARLGRDLEHGLHQLGLDLAGGRGLEQGLDRVDQLERLSIEDHQLFLDPDRERRTCEMVLHRDAA